MDFHLIHRYSAKYIFNLNPYLTSDWLSMLLPRASASMSMDKQRDTLVSLDCCKNKLINPCEVWREQLGVQEVFNKRQLLLGKET